ncbi:MAG TPA: GNAT family N-acetyltransferase [Bryobacteraceae bacterium]|nr:GNAT family N-acetyltransferase [Bryobacteraceae bacterium]
MPVISEMDAAIAGSRANARPRRGVQTIRTLAGLDRMASAWERLAADRNPVLDFAYARAWAAGLGGAQRLNVMTAGDTETLAIAPFVINHGGAGRLTLLAAEMYEIMDFVHADDSAVSELARAIVRTGRPLDLKRLPAESPVVAAMETAYRGRGIVLRRPAGGSPWIPLDDSWAEPEMRLEAGRRSDLRRARRQAEKMGAVETAIAIPTRGELPRLLEEAFQVEAAGWKGAHGTALTADPERGDFFRRYTERACTKGILRMCVLRIGGRTAAAQIAIESGSRFDLLRAGYDEQFSRCSPGMLLTAESIRYAARRGLRSYEFNGEVEPWTRVWTRHEHASCSLRAYPFSPRGALALFADGWKVVGQDCPPTRTTMRKLSQRFKA